MLLPDKYVAVERSLLGQAGLILARRSPGQTVSELWSTVSSSSDDWTFDRFSLALSLLHGLGLVRLHQGLLEWETSS